MAVILSSTNPYAAAESAIQGVVSSTVDFMAFIAAVLILITIAGLGSLAFWPSFSH
ncbi:hypothetical protein [Vulcanisaeta sp. JCM 16161]|uniref:hypothetical protein n=1 Tax=Vulcanisaeta sp. JCM 16161 TaxID=1295372 RepID=UPI000ABED6F1|nr:hypothetical protein [Vulcanisaeta sp. JCM 16161]